MSVTEKKHLMTVITKDALVGRSVWLKLDYFSSPIAATVDAVEADGLWFQSSQIMDQVMQSSHLQNKDFEGASLFVPVGRIDYILMLAPADTALSYD
jgi:hypothetical protein